MCGASAYDSYLEYAAVFPEIADLLNTSGVKAKVKNNGGGLLVNVSLPNQTASLKDGERDNWSIDLCGEIVELDIPVQNRDAKAIATALLKALGADAQPK